MLSDEQAIEVHTSRHNSTLTSAVFHHLSSTGKQIQYAFHVFTPALMYRFEYEKRNPDLLCNLPVQALRSSEDDFTTMQLFQRIECYGYSVCESLFHAPLKGTNDRGVAIMYTNAPIRAWFDKHHGRKQPIKVTAPDLMLEQILQQYNYPFYAKS